MNYNWDEQFLKRQADSELSNMQIVLKENNIDPNKKYSILDIGCSNGYNTKLVFQKYIYSQILGIDIDKARISNANQNNQDSNFSFICIDLLKTDINKFISAFGKFDIIFCSYVIQYFSNPLLFLTYCHMLLREGGMIFIKASDDNGKISYPKPEILKEIIELYSNYVAPDSDRFCASKCYSWLRSSGFTKIKYNYFTQDTTNLSTAEKISLYNNDFLFRKFNLDKYDKYCFGLQRYNYLLSLLYEMFQQDNFYYSSTSYIITAYF